TRPSSPILIRGADSPGVSGPAAPWGGGLVLLPPVVDQHLGLQHQVQRIEIEELLSQVPFVGLDERILPWRTWLDVVRCRAPSPAPPMQGLGDELRTTVAAHIGGRATLLRDPLQDLDRSPGGGPSGRLAGPRLGLQP